MEGKEDPYAGSALPMPIRDLLENEYKEVAWGVENYGDKFNWHDSKNSSTVTNARIPTISNTVATFAIPNPFTMPILQEGSLLSLFHCSSPLTTQRPGSTHTQHSRHSSTPRATYPTARPHLQPVL